MLEADAGANLRELMARMGHSSTRAADDLPALHRRTAAPDRRRARRPETAPLRPPGRGGHRRPRWSPAG